MIKPSTMIDRWYTNFETSDSSSSDKDLMQVCSDLLASISLSTHLLYHLEIYRPSEVSPQIFQPLSPFIFCTISKSIIPAKIPIKSPPPRFIADPVFAVEIPENNWARRHVFWRVCIGSYLSFIAPALSLPSSKFTTSGTSGRPHWPLLGIRLRVLFPSPNLDDLCPNAICRLVTHRAVDRMNFPVGEEQPISMPKSVNNT